MSTNERVMFTVFVIMICLGMGVLGGGLLMVNGLIGR